MSSSVLGRIKFENILTATLPEKPETPLVPIKARKESPYDSVLAVKDPQNS